MPRALLTVLNWVSVAQLVKVHFAVSCFIDPEGRFPVEIKFVGQNYSGPKYYVTNCTTLLLPFFVHV
jgi:hypothetical protein